MALENDLLTYLVTLSNQTRLPERYHPLAPSWQQE
jgi:hypothetical protein